MTATAKTASRPAPLPADERRPQSPQSNAHAREIGPKAERLSFGHPSCDDFLATLPPDAEMAATVQQRTEAEAEVRRLKSLLADALRQKQAAAAAVTGLNDDSQGRAHATAVALVSGLPARIGAAEEQRVLAALACIRRFTQIGQSEIQRLYDAHAPFADTQSELLTKLARHDNASYGNARLTDEKVADLRADIRANEARMQPLMVGDRDARQAVGTARGLAQEMFIESTDPFDWARSVTEKIMRPNAWAPAAKKAGEAARSQAEYEARGGDEARSGLRPRQ